MRVMVLYLRVPNRPQKAVYSGWRLEKIPGDLSPFSKEGNGFIPAKGKEHLIRPYIRAASNSGQNKKPGVARLLLLPLQRG